MVLVVLVEAVVWVLVEEEVVRAVVGVEEEMVWVWLWLWRCLWRMRRWLGGGGGGARGVEWLVQVPKGWKAGRTSYLPFLISPIP